MEVVAAVGSVVSIASIIGQSIESLLKLRRFVRGFVHAHRSLQSTLDDIESLKSTLAIIREFIDCIPEGWCKNNESTQLDTLSSQVQKCHDDVHQWIHDA